MLERKERKPALLTGVVLLSVANLIVKVLGLLFKIPLSYLLGDEGMGYFNAAYTIYAWLYMIATAGLPVAVSILISDATERRQTRRVGRIFRMAMAVFLTIGVLGFLLMITLSAPMAKLIGNSGSQYAIAAISPTLFFICIAGGIRGYFQGHRRMLPTAVSQVIEAIGKLVLGMLFGSIAAKAGKALPTVAAYAILGVTLGVALSSFYLLILGLRDRRRADRHPSLMAEEEKQPLFRALIRIAVPITVSSAVMNLTNLIDLGFIMNRLGNAGYAESEAAALFGNYTTLAMPMFHLPTVLIYPVACSLVPYLTAELAKNNRAGALRLTSTALRFVSVLSLPCALGLGLFGGRILSLFFRSESAEIAAPFLSALAPGIFFSGIVTVTNAILQANGKAGLTVWSMGTGAFLKTLVGYLMIGNPAFGIYGAAIGTVVCYAMVAIINLIAIAKLFGFLPSFSAFFSRPLAASGAAMLSSLLLARVFLDILPGKWLTGLILLSSIGFYLVYLFLFRAVIREDFEKIPHGEKLLRFMRRCRLLP